MYEFTDDEYKLIEDDTIRHEGFRNKIYLDTLGFATAGVGHLITKEDEEYYNAPVDTVVPLETITDWFYNDLNEAISDAYQLVDDFSKHPFSVQRVLVNMAFNLGYHRLSGFKNMLKAVNEEEYVVAAKEMVDSRWYRQVGHRSKELVIIMENS